MSTILCDMDGILVDLCGHWLKEIEKDHGIKMSTSEVDRWDLHKCEPLKPLGAGPVYGYLQKPGFFLSAPPLPGAIEGLTALHDNGHDIVIVSSPSGPISAKEKLEWLASYLPWLKPNDIMLANRKTLVDGAFLIDDHPETVVNWAQLHPRAVALGIRYPYNAHLVNNLDPDAGPRFCLFDGYQDTTQAWAGIGIAVQVMRGP